MQSLKGVGRLVEVYALKDTHLTVPNPDDYIDTKVEVHSDDEVPSIAIIPFENKGADEDVFYAYGISVDLISDVSSAGLIRVASKKQIEDAGDLPLDELAKKLDVRYMANGELWRMGDMFQLSVELYDTKDKKVVWSDRWQEKWDNLPNIKTSLSDGLLKALDTMSKVKQELEYTSPEAYEFYLKAKHKYAKRQNIDDIEIIRSLLNKSIELDDCLFCAKSLLGKTYSDVGEYDKAMKLNKIALKQSEKLNDKSGIGEILNTIGEVYYYKGDIDKSLEHFYKALAIFEEISDKSGMGILFNNVGLLIHMKGDLDKALDSYKRSLAIKEELDDKRGMGAIFNNIGLTLSAKGDLDESLDYYKKSLAIREEFSDKSGKATTLFNIGNLYWKKSDINSALDYMKQGLVIDEELGNKNGMGLGFNNIGIAHWYKGELNKALDFYNRSLAIREELEDKSGIGENLYNIGNVYLSQGNYEMALKYLEKSLRISKEIGDSSGLLLSTTTSLYLIYKHLGKDYDKKEIYTLINESKNVKYELNFQLYKLLDDRSFLENAYNKLQEKLNNIDNKLRKNFSNLPIPKEILEEWNKISN
tara:strand:+ start:1 stop:1764 length:1764 start_codon:yes stop_codon:yes gene_type:complete